MDRFQGMLSIWVESGGRRISMRITQGRDDTTKSKGEGEEGARREGRQPKCRAGQEGDGKEHHCKQTEMWGGAGA